MNLYLHFPFCQQKCFYCDFYSLSGQEALIDNYCQNLIKEILIYAQQFPQLKIDTIYLGGGTPSLIPVKNLAEILACLKQNFYIDPKAEISIEANPDSLNQEKLQAYLQMGINRLSLGVQAWQNSLLKKIGRTYQIETFLQAYHWARKAGFSNINLDLIFALPTQTLTQWQESLENVIALKPEHIACYSLEWDNHSIFAQQLKNGKIVMNTDELDRQMYQLACNLLSKAGYQQYEISNFALLGLSCQHNLDFWHSKDYLGLGAGATSLINSQTWQNTKNLKTYCNTLAKNQLTKEKIHTFNQEELITNFIMLALRTKQGLNTKIFQQKFGLDFEQLQQKQVNKLLQQQLLQKNNHFISLTKRGENVLNQVMLELV